MKEKKKTRRKRYYKKGETVWYENHKYVVDHIVFEAFSNKIKWYILRDERGIEHTVPFWKVTTPPVNPVLVWLS